MDINKTIITNIDSNNIENNTNINDMQRPDTLGAIDLQTNGTVNITSNILSQPIDITTQISDSNFLSNHWTRMMAEGDDQLSNNSYSMTIRPGNNAQIISELIYNLPNSSNSIENMQMISNPIYNFQLNLENNMQNRVDTRSNENILQINYDNVINSNNEIIIDSYSNLGRRTRAAGMDEIEMRQRLTPSSLEAEGWSDCESNGSNNPRERTYSDEIDGVTEATEADQYKMNPEADQSFETQEPPNRLRHLHEQNSILNRMATQNLSSEQPLVQNSGRGDFITQNCNNKRSQRQGSLNIDDINIDTGLLSNKSLHSKEFYQTSQDLNNVHTEPSVKDMNFSTAITSKNGFNNSILNGIASTNKPMQSQNLHNKGSLISNNAKVLENKLSDVSLHNKSLIQNFDLLNTHNLYTKSTDQEYISSDHSPNIKQQSKLKFSTAFEYGNHNVISNDCDIAQNLSKINKDSNFIKISKLLPTCKLSNSQIITSVIQPPSYANSIGAFSLMNQHPMYSTSNVNSGIDYSLPKISFNSNLTPILSSNVNSINDRVLLSLNNNGIEHSKNSVYDSFSNNTDSRLNEQTVHSLLSNAIKSNYNLQFNNDICLQNNPNNIEFKSHNKEFHELNLSNGIISNFDIISQGDRNLIANLEPLIINKDFSSDHIFSENNFFKNNTSNIYTNNMDLSHDSLESNFNDGNKIIELNDDDITFKYTKDPTTFSPVTNIPNSEFKKYEHLVRPIAHQVGSSKDHKNLTMDLNLNSYKFSDKYKRLNYNIENNYLDSLNVLNFEYPNRPNTAPNPRIVDDFKERISSSLSDKINKELKFSKSSSINEDKSMIENLNNKYIHSQLNYNDMKNSSDLLLDKEKLRIYSNKKMVRPRTQQPDLLYLENKNDIRIINSEIMNKEVYATTADSLAYKYKQGENPNLLANEEFIANIKLLNKEKYHNNFDKKNIQSNSFEKYKKVNEDAETLSSRVLIDKLSEERLKREFCEEEIQQLQMVRLKQQQELTVLYNENKTQKDALNKLYLTLEKLDMESQQMKSNYQYGINVYCEQILLLENHLKENKDKLTRSSSELVTVNQKVNNLEFVIMEKETQLSDLYGKFGKLQEDYANEIKRSQTILEEKDNSIDNLKIDFEKRIILTKKCGEDLLSQEMSKMQSKLRDNDLKLHDFQNQIKVKNDQLQESIASNLILEGKISDIVIKNKNIQHELKSLNTEKSEMKMEMEKFTTNVKDEFYNIEIKVEEIKSDYKKQWNELSSQHINEISQLKMECEERIKGERMLAQQTLIKMEQEFESVLTRSAIDARDLENRLTHILSENIWLKEFRDKSAIELQKLMKQHCDEALQVLYNEPLENSKQLNGINQKHQSTYKTEKLWNKNYGLKENKREKQYSEINQIMGSRPSKNIDLSTRTMHSQVSNEFQSKESRLNLNDDKHNFNKVNHSQQMHVGYNKRDELNEKSHVNDEHHRIAESSELFQTQNKINIGQMWPGDLHWKGNSDESISIDHNDTTQGTKYVNYSKDCIKTNNHNNESNSYANGDSNNDFSSNNSSVLLDDMDSNTQIDVLKFGFSDNHQIESKENISESQKFQNLKSLRMTVNSAAADRFTPSIKNNLPNINFSMNSSAKQTVSEQSIKLVGGQYSQFLTKVAQFRPEVESLDQTIKNLKINMNGLNSNEELASGSIGDLNLNDVKSVINPVNNSLSHNANYNMDEVKNGIRNLCPTIDNKNNLQDYSIINKVSKNPHKTITVKNLSENEFQFLNDNTKTNLAVKSETCFTGDSLKTDVLNIDDIEIVPPSMNEKRQLKLRKYIQKLLNPNANHSESDISEVSKTNGIESECESNLTSNMNIDEYLTNNDLNTYSKIDIQKKKSTNINLNKKSVAKNNVNQLKHSNKKGKKSNSAWK